MTLTASPRSAGSGIPHGRSRPAASSRRRGSRLRPSGFLWLIPAIIFSMGLIYFCLGYTVYISTLQWDGISPLQIPVGLDNYVQALQSPVFWASLWHTAVFLLVGFAFHVFFGFTFAVILHSNVRLKVVYKVIIFVPVILAPAIMAPVFRQIYALDGPLNGVLESLGLGILAQPWLGQSSTSLGVIISISVWQFSGLFFVLYYAAISHVEPEMLEAARLDGAGNLRVVASIIWPQMRGTTIALAMLGIINSLKLFDIPQLVTRGGPNNATEFLGTYIYRESIPLYQVGYGAALSVLLLILAIGTAMLFSRRSRKDQA